MPRSFVRTFTDPYDFKHAVRAAEVTGYVTERGDFRNELVQIDLHRLWMQAGSESLGRSIHIAMSASRSPILFLASSNQASIRQSGLELHPGQIAFFAPGASHYQASSSASHWASMSLTPEDLAAQSQALLGRNIAAPKVTRVLKPERSAMEHLVALHGAAVTSPGRPQRGSPTPRSPARWSTPWSMP